MQLFYFSWLAIDSLETIVNASNLLEVAIIGDLQLILPYLLARMGEYEITPGDFLAFAYSNRDVEIWGFGGYYYCYWLSYYEDSFFFMPKICSSSLFFKDETPDRSIYRHVAVDSILIDFCPFVSNTLKGYESLIIEGLPISVESMLMSLEKDLVFVNVTYD